MNDDAPPSSLAISFLDVLCCGLGGAIALFLVFSALPHQGQSRSVLGGNTAFGATSGFSELSSVGKNKGISSPVEIVLEIPTSATISQDFANLVDFEGGYSLSRKLDKSQAVVRRRSQILKPDGSVGTYIARYSIAGGQRAGRKIIAFKAAANAVNIPDGMTVQFSLYVGGDVTKGILILSQAELNDIGDAKATLLKFDTSAKDPAERVLSGIGTLTITVPNSSA